MPIIFAQRHYGSHILRFCSSLVTVQNTICGSAHSCSPDDGHNDTQNILRSKSDNKHQISCILLVALSSPCVHDARSQEPKTHRQFDCASKKVKFFPFCQK